MTGARVERLDVSVHTVPTDGPESDGTFEWDSTTIVVVEARAGGHVGIGYTYGHAAVAELIRDQLAPLVDAVEPGVVYTKACAAIRNIGRPGVGMMAVSAVDTALWDLRARMLSCSLVDVLPRCHDTVPIYGSGGFTTYGPERVAEQLGAWVDAGIPRVKMKVARSPADDPARIAAARAAIGEGSASLGAPVRRRVGRALVRGAGVVCGPRRAAARTRALDARHCGR